VFAPYYADEKQGGEEAEGEGEKQTRKIWDLENPSIKPY